MLLKATTCLALALTCQSGSAADISFASLDEYLSNLGGSKPGQIATADDSEHIFGMAQWPCLPQHSCSAGTRYVASVFVLKKLPDGRLKEVTHSAPPFEWPENAHSVGMDGAERKRSDSFSVSFHHFSPTGREEFTFVRRDSIWLFAGIDCGFIYMEDGDEAVGDSRSNKSINLLTGRAIETRYSANKLRATATTKVPIRRIPLSRFSPYFEEFSTCP